MWIFCGGMFRSDSTLQYQIASHIVEHYGVGRRITWFKAEEFDSVRQSENDDRQILVCKAHRLSPPIRQELQDRGGRVLTVHRDIRDVVVSAMQKNDWTFWHIWKNGLLKKWTSQFDAWAAMPQALVSRYAELISGIDTEAGRIGKHLGVEISPEVAAQIATEYSFDRQKDRAREVRDRKENQQLDTKFDPSSLLHYNHITSGGVGIFRSALRPLEVDAIESECRDWLERWGYTTAEV